jgi:hypothetical protein
MKSGGFILSTTLTFILVGCGAGDNDRVADKQMDLLDSVEANYKVGEPPQAQGAVGHLGVVRLFSKFEGQGEDFEEDPIVVRGTGAVYSVNGLAVILTAKHNIVPTVELLDALNWEAGSIDRVNVQLAVTHLGLEVSEVRLLKDVDLAVLILEPEHIGFLEQVVDRVGESEATIGIMATNDELIGSEVEVWGYPDVEAPQLELVSVTSLRPNSFVLNSALRPGFSGGAVLLSRGQSRHLVGLVIRSDEKGGQSIAVPVANNLERLTGGDAQVIDSEEEFRAGRVAVMIAGLGDQGK